MALIVAAEDDGSTLKLITLVLRNQGHHVLPADDGLNAWRLVREHRPDLIVSDINMPGLSGFELLQHLRDSTVLGQTPLILLTSLQERRDMRQGMVLGADDYLTKPLRPKELTEAVQAQLNRQQVRAHVAQMQMQSAVAQALEDQAWNLHEQYEHRLARELSEQWPGERSDSVSLQYDCATVLFADIRHYREWAAGLQASELSELLKRFYDNSGDTVHLFGASAMQFVGEGVLGVFAEPCGSRASSAPYPLRAIKAALGLRSAAAGMADYLGQRFPGRVLPPFEVGIALHTGPVAMMRLEGLLGGNTQLVPVGQTVNDTLAIQRSALHTGITVSALTLRQLTGAVRPLERYLIPLPHCDAPLDVCRVEPISA